MFPAPFLSALLHRVKAVVRRVAGPVAARVRIVPGAAAPVAISPELRRATRGWMRGKLRALSALTRRIEAVARPKLPDPSRRAAAAREVSAARGAVPPKARLPRGFGWMCAVEPTIRQAGAAFADWVSEPAMQAKVLAAPEAMARAISPILHATGATTPDWFPVVQKRAKNSARVCRERAELPADTTVSGQDAEPFPGFQGIDSADRNTGAGATSFARSVCQAKPIHKRNSVNFFSGFGEVDDGDTGLMHVARGWTAPALLRYCAIPKLRHLGSAPSHTSFVTFT
jgi:hypothetical protein